MNELPPGFECNAPAEGCFSPTDQYWIIRPLAEFRHDEERGWLCIGGPGVDGIEFGVLREKEGVFAHYPIEDEFVWKAASAKHLFTGWLSGEITV